MSAVVHGGVAHAKWNLTLEEASSLFLKLYLFLPPWPPRAPIMRTLTFLPWSKAIQADLDGCVSLWEKLYDHIHSSAPYKSDDVSFAACLWRLGG